jgi:hypothetical protein
MFSRLAHRNQSKACGFPLRAIDNGIVSPPQKRPEHLFHGPVPEIEAHLAVLQLLEHKQIEVCG